MGNTALCDLMMCKLMNLECVKLVLKAGGHELLAFRDEEIPHLNWGGNTIIHYASWRHQPDREVIKYLVSLGGPQLTEMKNKDGRRAEDRWWSDELKEYIAFTTPRLHQHCPTTCNAQSVSTLYSMSTSFPNAATASVRAVSLNPMRKEVALVLFGEQSIPLGM